MRKFHVKLLKSKKQTVILTVSLLVIIVALAAAVIMNASDSSNKTKTAKSLGQKKESCQLVSNQLVSFLLGPDGKANGKQVTETTKDIKTTSCSYSQPGASKDNGLLIMKLTVRAPLSDAGITKNKAQFEGKKPNTQDMPFYGDKAYWDEKSGEMQVLKNNTWYTFVYGLTVKEYRTSAKAQEMVESMIAAL